MDKRVLQVQQQASSGIALLPPQTELYDELGFLAAAGAQLGAEPDTCFAMVRIDAAWFGCDGNNASCEEEKQFLQITVLLRGEAGAGEFCAKVGRGCFALLLRSGAAAAERRTGRLLRQMDSRQADYGAGLRFHAGIAMAYPGECRDAGQLIDRAKVAILALKGTYAAYDVARYDSELVERHRDRMQISLQLEKALVNQEFELYLQPQIDIETNAVVGAEALCRWENAHLGKVSPQRFIPVMECSGLVVALDFFMLEQACLLLRRWAREGRPLLPISVNQSRIHLTRPDYVEKVAAMLRRYRVEPGYITFELTESAFYENREMIWRTSEKLRTLGVKLAIDDYGTGYSDLTLLKDCRVDILKIDKVILDLADQKDRDRVILKKTIELAGALQIEVLCEGVERWEQVSLLREMGCSLVQGFLYARPMPVEEYERKVFGA